MALLLGAWGCCFWSPPLHFQDQDNRALRVKGLFGGWGANTR